MRLLLALLSVLVVSAGLAPLARANGILVSSDTAAPPSPLTVPSGFTVLD